MSTVYVVGLGPGAGEQMTVRAEKILEACPVILGYTVYIDLVREQYPEKKFLSTPMKQEVKRCERAGCCNGVQWRCRSVWNGRADL